MPTTAPTLPGATPGPSVASDASGKEYDFTAVTAGYSHVCGLRSNGRALCWGRGLNGETEPPEGTFTSVSAGNGYTCGIKTDGSVSCWGIWGISYGMSPGSVRTHRRPEAPTGVFKSISAGEAHACGIKADDTLACWGGNRVNAGQATPPSGAFRSVSVGYAHRCGVTTNNLVVCWGAGYDGDVALPPGSFFSVSVGSGYSCGVKTDYSIVCWGSSVYGDMTPPAGRFSSVSASNIHACGVRLTGEVDCWGYWLTDVAPQGKFLSVSVAEAHRCAVGSDGAIACWGGTWATEHLSSSPTLSAVYSRMARRFARGMRATIYWPHCMPVGSLTTTITVRSIHAEVVRMGRQYAGTLMKRRLPARRPERSWNSAPVTEARAGSYPMVP